MNDIERAVSCFNEGFTCSQSILSTYGMKFGLTRELALKVAEAFRGGLTKNCGAVSGAFMTIGLKYGRVNATDEKAKEKVRELIKRFVDRFEAVHGAITCKELLGIDASTPEGRKIAEEKNLFETICPKLVQTSAEILEKLLEE